MSSTTSKHPSYDDIVRRTVPEPDSSFRPTPEQQRSTETQGPLPTHDDALADAVRAALAAAGVQGVTCEVHGGRVRLDGAVADPAELGRIEYVVRDLEGVAAIDNRLHVA